MATEGNVLFRRRLHRMLEPRPQKYHIRDGADAWGLVITRRVISGVQLWYAAERGVLTMGLTTPEARRLIPKGAVPPGAETEISPKGWQMFRWSVPSLSMNEPPEDQPGANVLVLQIEAAFGWFNATRSDQS